MYTSRGGVLVSGLRAVSRRSRALASPRPQAVAGQCVLQGAREQSGAVEPAREQKKHFLVQRSNREDLKAIRCLRGN